MEGETRFCVLCCSGVSVFGLVTLRWILVQCVKASLFLEAVSLTCCVFLLFILCSIKVPLLSQMTIELTVVPLCLSVQNLSVKLWQMWVLLWIHREA